MSYRTHLQIKNSCLYIKVYRDALEGRQITKKEKKVLKTKEEQWQWFGHGFGHVSPGASRRARVGPRSPVGRLFSSGLLRLKTECTPSLPGTTSAIRAMVKCGRQRVYLPRGRSRAHGETDSSARTLSLSTVECGSLRMLFRAGKLDAPSGHRSTPS